MNVFALLLAGHLVGDWIVQTDWQAANKAWPGPTYRWVNKPHWNRSVRANQAHMLTYHLTLAVFVLPVWHTWGTLGAGVVSWVTHGFIDRRWPVRRLLEATGSSAFAAQPWGVMVADQALHIAILAVIATAAS